MLYSAHWYVCGLLYIFRARISTRARSVYIIYIYNIIRIIIIIYYYNISYYYTDICAPYKRKLCGAPPDAMRSGSIRQPAAAFRVSRRPRVLDDYILPFVSYTHTHTHPTPLGRCNRAPSSGSFTSPPPPPQLSPSARDVWTWRHRQTDQYATPGFKFDHHRIIIIIVYCYI